MVNPPSWTEVNFLSKVRVFGITSCSFIYVYVDIFNGCNFGHFCTFEYLFLFLITHIYISKLVRFSVGYLLCKLWKYCYCHKTFFAIYKCCSYSLHASVTFMIVNIRDMTNNCLNIKSIILSGFAKHIPIFVIFKSLVKHCVMADILTFV